MAAEAFIIREVTGSRRTVRLTGRALPYQNVEFEGTQAHVQTWYPGNPVATLQLLGPREGNIDLTGTWKTSKLVGAVQLEGFDDIPNDGGTVTAEDLVQVFHRLRIAGNTIDLRWGPEVRRGIISRFTPNYARVEDIAWSLEFVPSQRGDTPTFRAALNIDPAQETQASMNDLSDAAADEPPNLIERARDTVRSGVDAMRIGVASFTQGVARLQSTANVATARYQQLRSITNQIQQSARALSNGTVDLPYTELLQIDDVIEVLRVEDWRLSTRRNTRRTAAAATRGRNTIGERATPGALATVTVRENQTLRQLALEFYGSADSWTLIADANGIVGSYVEPGTVLVIPRAPSTGSGTA